ncbi:MULTISPECIES: metalloregulator ArsR/SmtB family transcription factor [unclassified Variovorax]|jgi:DNA-binding transcriptional ArsR family regulator|uniref:ArsR/SmtB family transcription factor n=1 Tax=unclassified Variovorax TaxID=663243 RepID=UPI000F7F18C6|nr:MULTISPECIES: metalloregulator ArsR/SmtB family transcription factor [unclassified Variovorax]RSZ35986.1 ArsR family transcriptional regulator [Variovorax sp. 553]RSZ36857.1 ArsR family transcriptional regulator [Variovorax sp. 679]
MEESKVIQSLAALAQPLRLRVFRALVVAGPEGLTPGALVEAMGVPATSLSFHLKELTNSGLITQERNGRNLVYRAEFGQMNALLGFLTENCCAGAACAVDDKAKSCNSQGATP